MPLGAIWAPRRFKQNRATCLGSVLEAKIDENSILGLLLASLGPLLGLVWPILMHLATNSDLEVVSASIFVRFWTSSNLENGAPAYTGSTFSRNLRLTCFGVFGLVLDQFWRPLGLSWGSFSPNLAQDGPKMRPRGAKNC